jgi:hypothetical protein
MDADPNVKDYIELKTVKKVDYMRQPPRCDRLFPKWYLQSYLLGVQVMEIGYRNFRNQVYRIVRKPVKEMLRDAQKSAPLFDPDVDMGRVHAILSALLVYFRAPGRFVSAQDRFELRVDADGDVWMTLVDSSSLAA